MRLILSRLLTVLLLGTAGAATAQTVVATTVVDGREAELLSDNTWRFATSEPLEENCVLIDSPVVFCGPAFRWQRAPAAPGPAIDALFQVDDRNYGMIIAEGLGRADGLTEASLGESVLINAAAAESAGQSSVPVIAELEHEVEGKSYRTIAYQITLQGLRFTYLTTLVVEERNALQLTTYTISGDLTDSHRDLHDEFLSHIRLDRR